MPCGLPPRHGGPRKSRANVCIACSLTVHANLLTEEGGGTNGSKVEDASPSLGRSLGGAQCRTVLTSPSRVLVTAFFADCARIRRDCCGGGTASSTDSIQRNRGMTAMTMKGGAIAKVERGRGWRWERNSAGRRRRRRAAESAERGRRRGRREDSKRRGG